MNKTIQRARSNGPSGAGRNNAVARLVTLAGSIRQSKTDKRKDLETFRAQYLALNRDDKPELFRQFQENMELTPETVGPLLSELNDSMGDTDRWQEAMMKLRDGVQSPRQGFFSEFLAVPGGLKFLLDLRADILAAQRHGGLNLEPLDNDLVRLFEAWFKGGLIFLEEISLDSPYRQIEILKNRDMVHPMTSLEEMGRRLGRDRRCFALYHRAMPEEPVIFIEVALTKGVIKTIHEIIGPAGEADAVEGKKDTAIFYSINNTQNGLAGLGLGKLLIFQVVNFLKEETPEIGNFCTLSPMPGFCRRYLWPLLRGEAENLKIQPEDLDRIIDKKTRAVLKANHAEHGGGKKDSTSEILLKLFSDNEWASRADLVRALEKPLCQLGYLYLSDEKDRAGRPLDPVANFHLGNGATVSPRDVNFGSNWSTMGLERSLSLMVNYVYSLNWRRQLSGSAVWLGGWLPGLARRKGDRLPPNPS